MTASKIVIETVRLHYELAVKCIANLKVGEQITDGSDTTKRLLFHLNCIKQIAEKQKVR